MSRVRDASLQLLYPLNAGLGPTLGSALQDMRLLCGDSAGTRQTLYAFECWLKAGF